MVPNYSDLMFWNWRLALKSLSLQLILVHPSCPPHLSMPWHGAGILLGNFMLADPSTFYVHSGPVTGYTSFYLPRLHHFVVLGQLIWPEHNYTIYSALTDFHVGGIPSSFSINLLIPYYIGSPNIHLKQYHDWMCSSTPKARLLNKWNLPTLLTSCWLMGPLSTQISSNAAPIDEDLLQDGSLAQVESQDQSSWVLHSIPSPGAEVEDIFPPGIHLK